METETSGTVIFLGAGASYDLALPLAPELLPQIVARLRAGQLFQGNEDAGRALEACLGFINPGFPSSAGPSAEAAALPSITDLLSTIDYLLQSDSAPGPMLDLAALARGRRLLERAIFELVSRVDHPDALGMEGVPDEVAKEWMSTWSRHLLPDRGVTEAPARTAAADWILGRMHAGEKVTIISMNYDIEIEQELYARLGYDYVFERVDFGTAVREPAGGAIYERPADASLAVYKLHGSLNWLICSACDSLYVNPVGSIAYLSFLADDGAADDPWRRHLWEAGANQCHCGYRPLRHVIVAPSFVRNVHETNVLSIWRNAINALRRAGRWFLIGYSLPPEDVAIRSMLLRGYQARFDGTQPDIVVVQKGHADEPRYRALFRPTHFTYYAEGFLSYLLEQTSASRPADAGG